MVWYSLLCFLIAVNYNVLCLDCVSEVKSCPCSKMEWEARSDLYPCPENLNYTCMLTSENILVEACIVDVPVKPEAPGCPFINSCHFSYPSTVIASDHKPCKQNSTGCPTSNHTGYSLTKLYLYTDCIETNGSRNCEIDSHEMTTATSEEIKGGGLNIGYKILIALSVILMVGGILCAVLYKTYWRKKSRKAISESELREFGKLLPIRDENAGRPKKKHRCTKNKIRHGSQIVINEEDTIVEKLRRKLITMYDERAKCIPVSPLQKSFKLPLQQIYASVDISEDLQYNSHQRGPADDTHKPNQDSSGIDSEQEQSCINKTNQDPGANTMVSPYYIFCEVSDPESPPEPVEEIYLLGEAGRGKTTHCLWLIKQWCDAKTCQEPHMNDWQRYMNKFHIVFYLPIQNVSDPSRETFIDMFCNEMLKNEPNLHKTVEHVLHSESYHCLIIIDGLEDWKQSRDDTLPKFDKMSKCVYLITMRPWKFDSVEDTTLKRNKVLEIKGLDDEGMKQLIGNILVHHYKLKPDSECYKEKYHEITGNMEIEPFKSFMRIPLSAVFYIQICNTEGCSIESISSLYTAFFNMLIERVYTKKVAQKIDQLAKFETDSVPSSFTSFVVFTNCISLLSKLGKLAYDSLISDRKIMKYQRKELPKLVGDTELELALHFGLISLKETISVSAKQVTVNFFHKSAEEFLAAIYIVTEKESELFIKRLTNVNEIMKLSGVIKFICGISPSLGSRLSEEVAKVSEGDKEFCDKKKLPPFDKNRALAELFNQQINWYNELQDSDVTFQVSDIYLWRESIGNDAIRISRKLMFDRKTRIRSFTVVGVPEEGENALSNEDLNTFLADPKRTGSLAELSVIALTENERTLNNVSVHSLEALYLSKVMIHGTGESSTGPLILSGMENLKRLYLSDMPKFSNAICLTSEMKNIKKVRFSNIKMVPSAWSMFVHSLNEVRHSCEIEMINTDIDDEAMRRICECSHFNVVDKSMRRLLFCTNPSDVS